MPAAPRSVHDRPPLGVIFSLDMARHAIAAHWRKRGRASDALRVLESNATTFARLAARPHADPAVGLLAVGVVGLTLAGRSRRGLPAEPSDLDSDLERRDDLATAYFWTAVLLASMGPLVLGPAFSLPLFEVHMLAAAAVLLDAWEHRFSDRHLHALRYAFLMIAAIAVLWQVGVALPQLTPAATAPTCVIWRPA